MVRGPSKNTSFPSNRASHTPGLSIWEKLGWIQEPDAVVLGTGIVGMNTALELRKLHPDWHIVMLDRSRPAGSPLEVPRPGMLDLPVLAAHQNWSKTSTSLGPEALVKNWWT